MCSGGYDESEDTGSMSCDGVPSRLRGANAFPLPAWWVTSVPEQVQACLGVACADLYGSVHLLVHSAGVDTLSTL